MISEKQHLLVLLMQGLSLGTVQYNTPAAKNNSNVTDMINTAGSEHT